MMDDAPSNPPRIITQAAMDRWDQLPPDKPLQIQLTKADLDNLFLAIRETVIGQSDLASALIHASNQRNAEAQQAMDGCGRHIQAAMTHIDSLIVHAMTTAEPI